MTEREPTPFAEGYKAFNESLPGCPYPYPSPDYDEWWRGWQFAASVFLNSEFDKAAQL